MKEGKGISGVGSQVFLSFLSGASNKQRPLHTLHLLQVLFEVRSGLAMAGFSMCYVLHSFKSVCLVLLRCGDTLSSCFFSFFPLSNASLNRVMTWMRV